MSTKIEGERRFCEDLPDEREQCTLLGEAEATNICRRARIDELGRLAKQRRNPVYFWEAIGLLIGSQDTVPDWALAELKRVANLITDLAAKCADNEQTPPGAAQALPRILGFTRGTLNLFERYVTDTQHAQDYLTAENAKLDFIGETSRQDVIARIASRRGIGGASRVAEEDQDQTTLERSVKRRISKGKPIVYPAGG